MLIKESKNIAILVPDFAQGGGVPAVATFLYNILATSNFYTPTIISLATSTRDCNSIRLFSPKSWLRGIQRTEHVHKGLPYYHIGVLFSEFEFQRYQPNSELNFLLRGFDLVQVVAGTPSLALATRDYAGPVALQVATLTQVERETRLCREHGIKKKWLWLMTKINSFLEILALRRADVVFVENSWINEYLCKKRVENVIFAPPGVDTDFFVPDIYQENGYILSVGRFADPRKNVRLLFEAYGQLRKIMPNVPKLILAGKSGPCSEDLSYAVSLGIREKIEIHEGVSLDQLKLLYQNASLFVLSSNEEGLGIVLLEAMASGLPILSTRCGGPETAVIEGETGYLTPVGNAGEFASKMKELLENPSLRQEMGRAGRRVAEETFSLQSTSQIFLQTYDHLLNNQ